MQRNALLKSFYEKSYFDITTLEIYDEQLSLAGNYIFQERAAFFNKFNELFNQTYHQLTEQNEEVKIVLFSGLNDLNMERLLINSLEKDRASQYTNSGIHKDDLIFEIDSSTVKKFASQGQQKTFLIALKLAQYTFIAQVKEKKPILLLDDVYDKLDESRLNNIMQHISGESFGQIFITDTHRNRMYDAIGATNKEASYFEIEKGSIHSL
jgi:DNA replication and repair protein RecF